MAPQDVPGLEAAIFLRRPVPFSEEWYLETKV